MTLIAITEWRSCSKAVYSDGEIFQIYLTELNIYKVSQIRGRIKLVNKLQILDI